MHWNDLSRAIESLDRRDPPAELSGVQYDSRKVTPGDLFVAMQGETADGNLYLHQALQSGAVAVITDSRAHFETLAQQHPHLPAALVARGRRALAEASSAIFGHPERHLALTAVTGTNGKTTTAFLTEQMLQSAGRTCVLVGTIETHVAGEVRPSPHTTPESRDLLRTFADGVALGATEAVIEASSHALEQERVWGIPVDVAVWTNLTQDHLDYHQTMDRYFNAKARLFEGVGTPPPRVAVLNADDAWTPVLRDRNLASETLTYGIASGDFRAEAVKIRAGDTEFTWKTPVGDIEIHSPLTGRVNVYNLLAAACASLARGLTLSQIAGAAYWLKQVPGRFQVVRGGPPDAPTVVVDYAHTDDALRNLIALARDLVHNTGGRVITIFGCGGDRDRRKRPLMGRAAGDGSDLVVLTSDNPRSEDPRAILAEALAGVRETSTDCIVEPDRGSAISLAIHNARREDIVLIAGKGHERVQILHDGTVPFDDVAVASEILRSLDPSLSASRKSSRKAIPKEGVV